MKNQTKRHSRIGFFLLVLYLGILTTSVLHLHVCEDSSGVCQDCVEHVRHNAHFSQTTIMDADCVLCKIINTNYITPEVLTFSAASLLVLALMVCPVQDIILHKVNLPTLRAPPGYRVSI